VIVLLGNESRELSDRFQPGRQRAVDFDDFLHGPNLQARIRVRIWAVVKVAPLTSTAVKPLRTSRRGPRGPGWDAVEPDALVVAVRETLVRGWSRYGRTTTTAPVESVMVP